MSQVLPTSTILVRLWKNDALLFLHPLQNHIAVKYNEDVEGHGCHVIKETDYVIGPRGDGVGGDFSG